MSKEEKVDDPQQKETQTKTEETKKEEVKLPERKFFKGDKMNVWAEQMGLLKPDEPAKKPEEKEPEVKKEQKPGEEPPPKKEEKPGEEEKPFKVLTYKGEKVKIKTEEEFNKLASEGLDYTQSKQKVAERERLVTEREDAFKKISAPLETVAKAIENGELKPVKTEEEKIEESNIDKIVNNEEIDPEIREAFRLQNEELKKLKTEVNESKKVEQERVDKQKEVNVAQAKVELEGMVEKSREEHPFDEIVEKTEEGERNITESVFTGLVISKANSDRIKAAEDSTFQRRNLQDLITETAQDLQRVQKHYEAKHSISNEKEPVTSAKLKELYPDQIKEIEQDRVASYLEEQEKGAPIAKPAKEEITPPLEKKKKKEFKGVKDALEQAFEDPELVKALKDEGDKTLREIHK